MAIRHCLTRNVLAMAVVIFWSEIGWKGSGMTENLPRSAHLKMSLKINKPIGSEWLRLPIVQVALVAFAAVLGVVVAKVGLTAGLGLVGMPIAVFGFAALMKYPQWNLWGSLIVGFFSAGIGRYIDAPWGLLMDAFLVIGWLSLIFRLRKKADWQPMRNDIMLVTLIWYGMVMLELFNPEMRSAGAWFYAMRGAGLYQLLAFGLTFLLFQESKYLDKFLHFCILFSFLGVLWGLRQMIFGTDAAEDYWLYVEGFAMTHMLAGVLRVFSFYSDAGQFGAQQAMMFLVCAIIAIGKFPMKTRLYYGIAALIFFVGFGISGTRGALAVPAAGAFVYLILSKNFKLLAVGVLVMGMTFYFLKYTMALQSVEQVRRMRTAMNPQDESLLVRLRNQVTFGNYLRSRPIGGGIGSAGFWGHRFSPGTLLAETATDSYYVKVWAETGIVGICLHLFMFGYFVGKGAVVCWNIRDELLRQKIIALYAGMCGIFLSSYGNQVFSQTPTGIIMYIAIPLIFMSPKWDMDTQAANVSSSSSLRS